MSKRSQFSAAVLSFVTILAMAFAAPAMANHNEDHQKGGATTSDSDGRTDCEQNKDPREYHYDADCDGAASENGSKDGGGGKPCAGCVGKADNKNPPGQSPDENDSNKGYECDDNGGVGAHRGTGNPAHTGCRRDLPPSPPPPPPCCGGGGGGGGGGDEVSPALEEADVCDKDPNMVGVQACEETTVQGVRYRGAPRGAPAVAPAVTRGVRQRGGVLPFTGTSISVWLVAGLLLVALGWLLTRPGYLTRSR